MRFSISAFSVATLFVACVSARPIRRDVPVDLIPQFGLQAGLNPTGTGDCDGIPNAQGVPIKIPCACPPDRNSFIQKLNENVAAGRVLNNPSVSISFPTGNSKDDALTRLNAAAVTLQNLNGPGKGCPVAATTFTAQRLAIEAGQDPSTVAVATPGGAATSTPAASPATTIATPVATPSATPNSSSSANGGVNPALVPQFGVQSGVNPTGTGDCDGILGANGQPIKIPCACPPNRDDFIQKLSANVAAGFVLNNPTVKLSFPEGSSKEDQLARLNAAAVTLQNLNGPGKGCPVAATTFAAQNAAINAGQDPASVVNKGVPVPSGGSPAAVATSTSTPVATSSQEAAAAAPTKVLAAPATGGIDESLVPQFGVQSNVNPTGTGDCDGIFGANGQPIKIPCACPPDRATFIQKLNANLAAGHVTTNPSVGLSFPTDNSKASQLARLNAAAVTLQNLNGPGKGCPVAATTFTAQRIAIENGQDPASVVNKGVPTPSAGAQTPANTAVPATSPATTSAGSLPASSPSSPTSGSLTEAQVAALAPPLGFAAGKNPTGTGDCDGAVNGADGKPIKVPCSCPPPQDEYIRQLTANANAGKALNNPTVGVSFPQGSSNQDKAARIQAALVTLQNLNGPGKGCPAASTTLLSQLKAVQ